MPACTLCCPQVLEQGKSPKGGLTVKSASGNAAKVRGGGAWLAVLL
jgi:hypothetical protein